jgi:hypothetical protein
MPKNYVVVDKRVGRPSDGQHEHVTPRTVNCLGIPGTQFAVDEATKAGSVFDALLKDLGSDKIGLLTILAHGYFDPGPATEGIGIEFGEDDILISNVQELFSRFQGKFQSTRHGINIIGCAVAGGEVFSRPQGPLPACIADGIALCQFIADTAGTAVRASPDIQNLAAIIRSERAGHTFDGGQMVPTSTATVVDVDPGPWEGRVWNFYPRRGR